VTDLQAALDEIGKQLVTATKPELKKLQADQKKTQAAIERPLRELAKRDEEIAAAHRKAAEDHQALRDTADELLRLYGDPSALAKHARIVCMDEIEDNEHNLNIPRYVDTFEPEQPIVVANVLKELRNCEAERSSAENELQRLLTEVGYER
jgi:type I restriction enzyme M protein